MSDIYKTKEFKDLQAKWYSKLHKNGFDDLEDSRENLFKQDTRTLNWQNRIEILYFFLALDNYLSYTRGQPRLHRRILRYWSRGIYLIEIAKRVNMSLTQVKRVIAKYKQIVIQFQRDESLINRRVS